MFFPLTAKASLKALLKKEWEDLGKPVVGLIAAPCPSVSAAVKLSILSKREMLRYKVNQRLKNVSDHDEIST